MDLDNWDIVGIPPTDDSKALRKAYAQALRKHPPETDPEGFMRLREAYERLSDRLKTGKAPTSKEASDSQGSKSSAAWSPQPVQIDRPVAESPRAAWSEHPQHSKTGIPFQVGGYWLSFQIMFKLRANWSRRDLWNQWFDQMFAEDPAVVTEVENRILEHFGKFFLRTPDEEALSPLVRILVLRLGWETRQEELLTRFNPHLIKALVRVSYGDWNPWQPGLGLRHLDGTMNWTAIIVYICVVAWIFLRFL